MRLFFVKGYGTLKAADLALSFFGRKISSSKRQGHVSYKASGEVALSGHYDGEHDHDDDED
ncbi:hypothetical protein [Paenibacillus chitinolyticus]|uniref:Uncharacterized protein n=1 Tax=Paenibacillus chitinolyticus TaxID=79263 RepID=A0ABT4FCQ4_9BACL|nr:hypothetical protein [Paenibacillus chitinolyticus]MCY9589942.1 hypothetical protein [Paenibacillus chitinolyticus]MCY9596279.1 hypothetical protein [Paenibacillus chitinolyticus]